MAFHEDNPLPVPINNDDFPVIPDAINTSPDRRWIFYFQVNEAGDGEVLWIQSIDGTKQLSAVWEPEWGKQAKWLDAQRLVFESALIGDYNPQKEFIILNPFTGETVKKTIVFSHHAQFMGDYMALNPNLNRILYVYNSRYVLLNTDSMQDIWDRWGYSAYGNAGWSPDGIVFVIHVGVRDPWQEMYKVGENGKEERLTDLIDAYDGYDIYIFHAVWSPDGKNIAMMPIFRDHQDFRNTRDTTSIMVYNRESGEIVDYCLPASEYIAPVWSPDGRYLVFGSPQNYTNYFKRRVAQTTPLFDDTILLDPFNGYAVKIASAMAPSMWMAAP